eukprot:GHVS01085447.1.p1 GENE.GHVS01085447.1~~GHVS01085447.1.p1  ORF type:complete len:317 (+),score=42.95 GHVS01085447.1:911-1861(+)
MKDLVTYALEKTEVNVDSLQDALPGVTESQAGETTVPHDSWKQPGVPFPQDPPSAATFDVTSMDNLKNTARDKTTGTGMKDLVTYALEKTEVNVDSLQDALPSVTESQAKEMTVPHDSKQPTSPEGLSQAIAQFPRVVFGRWKQPGMPFPEDPPSAATFDVTSMDNLKYTARDKTTGTVNTLMCDPNFKECSFMAEFKTGIVKFFASQHLEGWEEEEVEKPVIPLSVEEQEVLKGEKGELYGGSGIVIDDINVLIVVNEKLPTEDVETAVTKFAEQYIQLLRKFDECWSFRLIKIRKIGQRDLRLSVAKVMANYVF